MPEHAGELVSELQIHGDFSLSSIRWRRRVGERRHFSINPLFSVLSPFVPHGERRWKLETMTGCVSHSPRFVEEFFSKSGERFWLG